MIIPPMCLLYHRIATVHFDPFSLAVSAPHFAAHLDILTRTYRLLDAAEFDDCMRRGRFPRRGVILTFDDGYEDNFTVAWPMLHAAGVPATFFLLAPDANVDDNRFWWDTLARVVQSADWPCVDSIAECLQVSVEDARALIGADRQLTYFRLYRALRGVEHAQRIHRVRVLAEQLAAPSAVEPGRMSSAQAAALGRAAGMSVGSHGQRHEALAESDRLQAIHELCQARNYLSTFGDHAVNWFAYPFGREGHDFDDRDVALAKMCGFSAAFAVSNAKRALGRFRRFAIQRWCVPNVSGDGFHRFLGDIDA